MKPDAVIDIPQPWLENALEQLDLRRRDRCLVLTCPTQAHLGAVSQIVGRTASIVVVEPDEKLAKLASRGNHEQLEVLAYEPKGSESFGTFDALLACPLTTMGWSIELWGDLIAPNLRPGGRFVIDLPGETLCEPLQRAWKKVGGDEGALRDLHGPAESTFAQYLRERGLRSVEAAMGTHMLHLESPWALADLIQNRDGTNGLMPDLELALVEDLQTNGPVDVVFHRTRVHGLR